MKRFTESLIAFALALTIAVTFILSAKVETKAYLEPLGVKGIVWGVSWYDSTYKLYNSMRKLGYSDYHSKLIINKCKKYSVAPRKCILSIASIGVAESSSFKHCYRNNCLSLAGGRLHYKSVSASLDDWIRRFNKYWYTFDGSANYYYSINGIPSRTRYCTEEASSGLRRFHCINGYMHFNRAFHILTNNTDISAELIYILTR